MPSASERQTNEQGGYGASYLLELYTMDTMETGRGKVWSTCERPGMHSRVVFGFNVGTQPRPGRGYQWFGTILRMIYEHCDFGYTHIIYLVKIEIQMKV